MDVFLARHILGTFVCVLQALKGGIVHLLFFLVFDIVFLGWELGKEGLHIPDQVDFGALGFFRSVDGGSARTTCSHYARGYVCITGSYICTGVATFVI